MHGFVILVILQRFITILLVMSSIRSWLLRSYILTWPSSRFWIANMFRRNINPGWFPFVVDLHRFEIYKVTKRCMDLWF